MKLNNFESSLVYYSKGWFDEEGVRSDMPLKKIFNTTYIHHYKDNVYSSHLSTILIKLLIKISPTQKTNWFNSNEEFVIKILSELSPNPLFDNVTIDINNYWNRVIEKLLIILSGIQIRSGRDGWEKMPEEIEMATIEEIKEWIDDNQWVDLDKEKLEIENVKNTEPIS